MHIDLTTTYIGIISLIIFFIAYVIVMVEEFTHLRKSKPVIISAALIWAFIGYYYSSNGINSEQLEKAFIRFEEISNAIDPDWIKSIRRKSLDIANALGLPTARRGN